MPPRISVLLPARDAATTLAVALESLRRQSEPRWECVTVVDTSSLDGTVRTARALAAREPRVRSIEHDRGPGIVAALELGLAHCQAPLVARMDADDVSHRLRLEQQADALDARPELCGLGCHVRLFPRDGLGEGLCAYEAWLNGIRDADSLAAERFVECPIAHPALMIRRATLAAFGYRDLGWPEDWDLVLRLCAAGERLGMLPRRRIGWRDHPARLSRQGPAYQRARLVACRAWFLAHGPLAAHERYVLWGFGRTGRVLRQALLEHGKTPSHVVELHPRRLGQRIHGAPVVPPERVPDLPRAPIVVSVAGTENRTLIRRRLAALGYRELSDFVCAA